MPVEGRVKLDLTDSDFDAVLERYDTIAGRLRREHVPQEVLLLFADRIRISACGCWIWTGGRSEKHYGRFGPGVEWADSYRNLAHRAAVTLFTGKKPGKLVVDHTCPNRSCVAPYHLKAVTHEENVSLGHSRRRSGAACGEGECSPDDEASGTTAPVGDWVDRWRKSWSALKAELPEGSDMPDRLALFSAYVDVDGPVSKDPLSRVKDSCWLWEGGGQDGYGSVSWACPKGTARQAHIWSYKWFHGSIADKYVVDHLCRNRRCVRPSHLEQVSRTENLRRGIGIAFTNAAKETCHKGHPLSGTNLRLNKYGRRVCKSCDQERAERYEEKRRQRREEGRSSVRQKDHCPNLHEYTPENTAVTPQGFRRCRKCSALAAQRRRLKEKGK